jgi:MFS family permease
MSLRPYLELMRQRPVVRIFVASLIGRLPMGMMAVAVVLFTEQWTGSLAAAGIAAGVYGLSGALCTPIQGRAVDRLGRRPVLLTLVVIEAAAIVVMVLARLAHAPAVVLILLAAIAGASRPALAPSVRSLLRDVVSEDGQLDSIFALEGTVVELLYTVGPLLTAAIVALASPAAALIAAAAFSVMGTVGFVTAPAAGERPQGATAAGKRHLAWALRTAGIRTTTLTGLTMGLTFGCIEVGAPAMAIEAGQPALGGVALGASSIGSLIAGLWYGSRKWSSPRSDRYRVCSLIFALGFLPLAFASSILLTTVLLLIAGLTLAPLSITAFLVIDDVAAEGSRTEAYAWASTATAAGAALGGALAGILSGAGSAQAALVAATVAAFCVGLVGVARHGSIALPAPEEQMA